MATETRKANLIRTWRKFIDLSPKPLSSIGHRFCGTELGDIKLFLGLSHPVTVVSIIALLVAIFLVTPLPQHAT